MGGLFIVLEGLDGCGKTTQAEKLARHLRDQGHEVLELKEPGGTGIGDRVREWFLDASQSLRPLTEAFLIEASRHELVEARINQALVEGQVVICQRYTYSTLAYQGYGRGLDVGMLSNLNQAATGGLVPDLTILIDISAETAWERLNSTRNLDRLENEGLQFLTAVQSGYHVMADEFPEMIKIDGSHTVETVYNEIVHVVERIEGGENEL